jgi:hypothetical protein
MSTGVVRSACDTITISSSDYSYNSHDFGTVTLPSSVGVAQSVYTVGSGITINDIDINTDQFTFNFPEEWVDSFPEWDRVKDMCKQYPGLEIAFRNFQTVYQLVKDDYDNPTPKK